MADHPKNMYKVLITAFLILISISGCKADDSIYKQNNETESVLSVENKDSGVSEKNIKSSPIPLVHFFGMAAVLLSGMFATAMIFNRKQRKSLFKQINAEREANKNREFIHSLLNAVPSAVFFTDKGNCFKGCNKVFADFLGVYESELIGKNISEIWPDDSISNKINMDIDLKTNPGKEIFASMIVDQNGNRRSVIFARDIYLDEYQKPAGLVCSFIDITKRKHAEDALYRSEERAMSVIEQSLDGISLFDESGIIIEWNNAQENITGISRSEALGEYVWDIQYRLVPDEIKGPELYRLLEKGYLETIGRAGNIRNFRLQDQNIQKIGGKKITVQSVTFKINLENECLVGNIMRDVTEEKKVKDSLLMNERKYREMFNATGEAIFILNALTGELIDVNTSMLSMYGYGRNEALNLTINDFSQGVSPYAMEQMAEKLIKCHDSGKQIFEWRAKKRSGELFWVEITMILSKIIDDERIVAVARDITDLKLNQEMLIQNEKMLSVGGLAAGMAHEINNPLAGMLQTANVMANRLYRNKKLDVNFAAAEKAGTTLNAIHSFMEAREIPRMLNSISESGLRIAEIVNNILSFSRKSNDLRSSYNLNKLMDKSLELASTEYNLKTKFDFKNIRLIREYDPKLPLVICDGGKIQQVFLNILRNGAEAMQEEGTNEPEFRFRSWSDTAEKKVCIEIWNNGPYLDEETRKRVFEPFFTTKPVGIGTGLGMSVSYFIISENHNGDMIVDSSPGEGVKFYIKLPIKV